MWNEVFSVNSLFNVKFFVFGEKQLDKFQYNYNIKEKPDKVEDIPVLFKGMILGVLAG